MRRACLTLVALLPLTARADGWPVPRGPSREPAPYRFDARALAKAPPGFLDDSVATLLYAGTTHLVEPDGTVETITHEVTRLNGRKGVEKLGEFRGVTYTPSHQKLTLNEARIHKRDGSVVPVEPRHVHLRDVATDYHVYDPEKQLVISFPGLEVGDTVEVKWTTRGKNPEHAGQFFTRYSFGDPQYPALLDELRVRLPRDKPLKHACVNGSVEPEVRDLDGARLYVWRAVNRPRPPQDDNLPSKEERRPTVAVSTFASWEEVGRWKRKLREDCWKCTPEVRKVVEAVTKGLATPAEKARALTYWVRRNVRYVSAGERHDFTPHAPDKVLANRFGDCKDTSQLLAVLLREAGVPVELATLGTRDDGQVHPDVPSPWGTHAILLATLDGKEHWIDTTASLAGWDFLPRDDLDRLCYLTDADGKLRLKRTPPPTPERNKVEQTTDVWLGHDGTSRCRRAVTAHGASAISARDGYVEVPPGERRRQLTAELQDSNSRTRLLRLRVDEAALMDFDRPAVVEMEFEIPRHFSGTGEREGSVTDSKVWGRLLSYNVDHDRKAPFVLPSPFEAVHTYRFHAPAVLGFDGVPKDKLVRSKWGAFRVTARALDDGDAIRRVEVVFHTRMEKTRVEVEDLEAYRKFHDEVNREYRVWLTLKPVTGAAILEAPVGHVLNRVWLTLKPVTGAASAATLERLLTAMPHDAEAAAALAKLYVKANRLADASRVLERACHYHPDDEALWDLRVQAVASAEQEERLMRELVSKYPGRVKHLLGLAAVLITRGKHAEARALLVPVTEKAAPASKALAHYQLARSHYRKDELKEALAHLDEAAKADRFAVDTARAHVLRGQVLEELKRPAEAVRAYENALDLEPANQTVLLSLVRLCLVVKDEMAALDHLRRYARLAARDLSGLLLAAETYYRLKRYDEALELALRAREIGFHEKGQRILGLVYLQRSDFARARAHLDRAEPDALVLAGLLRSSLALGKVGELEKLLVRAERLDRRTEALERTCEQARRVLARRKDLNKHATVPKGQEAAYTRALDALACAEELGGDRSTEEAAERLLKEVDAANFPLGAARALSARLLLGKGQIRSARHEADLAIRLWPDDPAGYHVRGLLRREVNEPGALSDLEKAAKMTGHQDAAMLVSLALAQADEKKADLAVRTMKRAIKLRPKDRVLAEYLKRLEAVEKAQRRDIE